MTGLRAVVVAGLAAVTLPTAAQPNGAATRGEEITFQSGDIALVATLLLPPGEGPFPAAVIVHGSGSSDRSNPWTEAYANALVARGIAVLHPDKRGSGGSGGAWQRASLLDLAGDAAAAVDYLEGDSRIDHRRTGLIGFSQGGHVAPAAAAGSEDVDFVIDVSGSTVPILEQIGDELALMGEREGLTPTELDTLASIHAAGVEYVLSGDGWDEYISLLRAAQRGRMGRTEVLAALPAEPDSPAWVYARTLGAFDPMDHWTRLEVPMLFVFGGRDTQVRVSKSVDRIEEMLGPLDRDYSVLFFRTNGHALYRDDALDFVARWIRDSADR